MRCPPLRFLSDAEALLDLFLAWEVQVPPPDADLVWRAFEWAERIKLLETTR